MGACLSLTGRYQRFGRQAARALTVWEEMDGRGEVVIEDDASDPDRLAEVLARLSTRSDVLLGPYSTQLTRRAAEFASARDLLLWNHGGAGDDVQTGHPGHVVSMLTPASRYARPYLSLLQRLARAGTPARLWIVQGRGSFGRQVAAGAEAEARRLGLEVVRVQDVRTIGGTQPWDVFSAGSFDDDVAALTQLRVVAPPPQSVCAVAAGVSDFRATAAFAPGILGVAQWRPGQDIEVDTGPAEADFVFRYRALTGRLPDYPAVQAAAAAAIAAHCAYHSGALTREALWAAAASLTATTLFGQFRIDRVTGAQTGHQMVLVRWTDESMVGAG